MNEREGKTPSAEFSLVLNRISEVLDSNAAEEQKKFISERLAQLTEQSQPRQVSLWSKMHEGFLHPKTEIKRVLFLDGFYIDDDEVYELLVDTFRDLKTAWQVNDLRKLSLYAVQQTLEKYFGNVTVSTDTVKANAAFYMSHTDVESEPLSIKEYKGKAMAVCAEKAALAQNLASFLGIDSILVAASKAEFEDSESQDGHMFNLFETDKGWALYDPSNPNLVFENGKIVGSYPAAYKVSSESVESFKKGGEIDIQHHDLQKGPDGATEPLPPKQRRYKL